MLLEPIGPLEEGNAFPAGVVMQLAIQSAEGQQARERQFALRAPGLLLVDCPVQQATRCSRGG